MLRKTGHPFSDPLYNFAPSAIILFILTTSWHLLPSKETLPTKETELGSLDRCLRAHKTLFALLIFTVWLLGGGFLPFHPHLPQMSLSSWKRWAVSIQTTFPPTNLTSEGSNFLLKVSLRHLARFKNSMINFAMHIDTAICHRLSISWMKCLKITPSASVHYRRVSWFEKFYAKNQYHRHHSDPNAPVRFQILSERKDFTHIHLPAPSNPWNAATPGARNLITEIITLSRPHKISPFESVRIQQRHRTNGWRRWGCFWMIKHLVPGSRRSWSVLRIPSLTTERKCESGTI